MTSSAACSRPSMKVIAAQKARKMRRHKRVTRAKKQRMFRCRR